MYAEHLDGWARVVGRDRLVVMVYEEVVDDPQSACVRVWQRLGLTPVELRNVEAASRYVERGGGMDLARRPTGWLSPCCISPRSRGFGDDWGVEFTGGKASCDAPGYRVGWHAQPLTWDTHPLSGPLAKRVSYGLRAHHPEARMCGPSALRL